MEHTRILSLGAGVQSSTLALMAATGETEHRLDAAIFADTQAEPQSVYKWLGWLVGEIQRSKYPYPVIQVTKGSLTDMALLLRDRPDREGQWTKSLIPCFTLEPNGKKGHMQRACTYDYKVRELIKAQRRIGGIKRGQKTVGVIGWIGISTDESHRMKPSREPWCEHEWPLIDMGISRQDCFRWMKNHGYPKPPRSACVYCPYHDDTEWLRLKTDEPVEFAKAVQFEKDLQNTKAQTDNMRGVPYLHSSRVPLDTIDFKANLQNSHPDLFGNECEGLCGV
ncbi:hypothetical protein LCGC14_0342810 [marine sediment metagenome]|uniref:Phosphoadenosine phosphosulphate reductase domain-containing protein n=1 Tax=marine sediment metagenome TaxID=412755 RepID=A0A0F9WKR7_9ZZZZ